MRNQIRAQLGQAAPSGNAPEPELETSYEMPRVVEIKPEPLGGLRRFLGQALPVPPIPPGMRDEFLAKLRTDFEKEIQRREDEFGQFAAKVKATAAEISQTKAALQSDPSREDLMAVLADLEKKWAKLTEEFNVTWMTKFSELKQLRLNAVKVGAVVPDKYGLWTEDPELGPQLLRPLLQVSAPPQGPVQVSLPAPATRSVGLSWQTGSSTPTNFNRGWMPAALTQGTPLSVVLGRTRR